MERENASSVKNTIIGILSGGAAIAGAIGSYWIAGPSGARAFLTAIAGAAGGGGIGAGINAIIPASWINSESIPGRTIQFLTSNLHLIENFLHLRNQAIENEGGRSNVASTSASGSAPASANANAPSTPNGPMSFVMNGVKSIARSAIHAILHYRFRRN